MMLGDHLRSARGTPRRHRGRGFTLVEMAMTGACLALLTAIVVPSYTRIMQRTQVSQCVADLSRIALRIQNYSIAHGGPPMSLNDLGMTVPKDPWGRDYRFLNFSSPAPGVSGMIRKDHNLHPLNTEFDLYSVGKDGSSAAALTALTAKDDVIWARDGAFVGIASDY
jgi:general secretion pathway protein G